MDQRDVGIWDVNPLFMKNQDVHWMAEDIGCKEHADSPIWSHLLMTVKIFLGCLEKQIQIYSYVYFHEEREIYRQTDIN